MSKKYRVDITASAAADIRSTRALIAADNPRAADRWIMSVERAIQKLERFPFAYEVIPEAKELGREYRHKLLGNYRVIYRVADSRVIIMRVFHGARLLDQSHLQEP